VGESDQDSSDERVELVRAIAESVGGFLLQFAPGLSEASTIDLAVRVAQEQVFEIDAKIAPTLVGELAEKYPTLLMQLHHVSDSGHGVTVRAAKALTAGLEIGVLVQTALLLSFVNAPHIRAALRTLGYVYSFGQSADVPGATKPRILM
jgi:hypothetical protein